MPQEFTLKTYMRRMFDARAKEGRPLCVVGPNDPQPAIVTEIHNDFMLIVPAKFDHSTNQWVREEGKVEAIILPFANMPASGVLA